MEKQKCGINEIILCNKGTPRVIIPDFKLYYRAAVLKQPGIGIKTDRRTNGIESKTYKHLVFDKEVKNIK